MKNLLCAAAALAILTPAASYAGMENKSYDKANKTHTSAMKMADEGIVDIAVSNEQFSTLVAALKAADLVGALQGEGPFTVFAPTNDAFAALPEGTVENLLKPENKSKLQEILKYHVVSGKVMSGDIAGTEQMVKTLAGAKLDVNATGNGVMVDNAQVVKADIKGSNGIIHVIDKVVLPK